MSVALNLNQVQAFTYSPNNKYKNEYENACKKFVNIQNKVVDYENHNSDRTSNKYQQLIKEFEYWDSKVPEISNIAGAEEEKLKTKEEMNEKEGKQQYKSIDFMA